MPSPPLSLDPALLAQIADLELAARLIVEGARLGSHRSPYTGTGAEFQQMRPYLPGDDLKHLDWKHYARTDRLFTRVYRQTTEWPVMIAIDTSGSMGFADGRALSKLRMAVLISAALTYLLVQQGEAVGLVGHGEEVAASLPARTGHAHMVRMLGTLAGLNAAGQTDLAGALRRAVSRLGRRGCLVLISDLYGVPGWHGTMREARRMGHEVVVFHVLTPDERILSGADAVEFVDLETGQRLVTEGAAVRAAYTARMTAFVSEQRTLAHADGITFVAADTSRAIDDVLRDFMRQRAPQAGGVR
ncbi:MAG: DUF58 domain-containing protein [Acidobacteria bacterium]|nr:DUF58 domain-containing protein [Acidobacteriota bacterium]